MTVQCNRIIIFELIRGLGDPFGATINSDVSEAPSLLLISEAPSLLLISQVQ